MIIKIYTIKIQSFANDSFEIVLLFIHNCSFVRLQMNVFSLKLKTYLEMIIKIHTTKKFNRSRMIRSKSFFCSLANERNSSENQMLIRYNY